MTGGRRIVAFASKVPNHRGLTLTGNFVADQALGALRPAEAYGRKPATKRFRHASRAASRGPAVARLGTVGRGVRRGSSGPRTAQLA